MPGFAGMTKLGEKIDGQRSEEKSTGRADGQRRDTEASMQKNSAANDEQVIENGCRGLVEELLAH